LTFKLIIMHYIDMIFIFNIVKLKFKYWFNIFIFININLDSWNSLKQGTINIILFGYNSSKPYYL